MRLLDREVAGSKTKLVTRNEVGKVQVGPESLQEFLKDLRRNGEKADRAIRSDVMGRLTRFWNHYNLCKFSQERIVGEAEHAVIESGKEDDSLGRYFLEYLPRDEVVTGCLAHIEARNHC
jgi:hypothetical protein